MCEVACSAGHFGAVVPAASIAAWNNETHVVENRDQYQQKFRAVTEILNPVLPVEIPQAGFYLWTKTPVNDEQFAQRLFADQHVTVLPGSYLSRQANGVNPGSHYVRMALVADIDECVEAAERIKETIELM